MKRVLSLVLALVMVLGTMPMAFAADETAGEMLQAAGFVAGDENGNLMEDQSLTRAELAVLVAELNGVKENAKTYAIAPEFADVTADDWFGPYVAYAAKEGWFKGDTEGNFNPNGTVSDQTMATVMLRALGYEPAWETAVSEAKAMGLPVGAADASMMTRGEAFATMWGVVNTPKKDSDVALGVELGKIEPAQEEVEELVAEIDFARAYGNALINVDFFDSVDAAAAGEVSNYTIVEKADTTKEIAILSVDVFDGDDVFLETEALTAGKAYTVIVGDSKVNFSGIAKDSDKPAIDSVKGTDDGVVEVVFEDAYLDRASAEDVANYSIDKEGTVVKAEMDSDLLTVTLTIEGMTSTKSKKLTVENVMSSDGVVMTKTTKSFGPDFDKTAPKIDDVKASYHNNVEVLVVFDDDHGVDKATAEDVSNYSIDGLEIISAEAIYVNGDVDDYYNKVILTTSEQKKSKKYELEVKYMVDGSTAANATTKVLKETFTGGSEDDDEPKVLTSKTKHRNLTEIEVVFKEGNMLDVSTVLDAGNYTFEDDELEVVDVAFDDADDNGNSYDVDITGAVDSSDKPIINKDNDEIKVIVTVTEMEEDESYRLQINNIADNFGNVMDKEEEKTIRVNEEVLTYAQIKNITANDLEKITVEFDGEVIERSAEDATNYVIDGGIGAVKKAVWTEGSDTDSVTLTVPELTKGKTYTLTINNVENHWGYSTEDVAKQFIATNDEVDNEQPEVEDVDEANYGEVLVTFSEAMEETSGYMIAKDTTATTARYYKFSVVDTREDDELLVFNAYEAASSTTWDDDPSDDNDVGATTAYGELTGTVTTATVPTDHEFEIIDFFDIKDVAGNEIDYDANDETFATDSDAFNATDDAVEADGLAQEDGNTVEVVFDRPVTISGNEESTIVFIPYDDDDDDSVANDGYMQFTYEITGDDDDIITFTKTVGSFPDESVELHFNFSELSIDNNQADNTGDILVKDVLGRTAKDEVGKVDVDNDDEAKPVLEEVEVIDNETILLHFDEKLKTTGSYKVINTDDDDDNISIKTGYPKFDDEDKANIVKIVFSEKLTTDNYELSIVSSPKDLANNKVDDEDETWSFVGTDATPAQAMVAAEVLSQFKINVQNEEDDFVAGDNDPGENEFVIKMNGNTIDSTYYTVQDLAEAADDIDITFDVFYALLKEDADDNAVSYTMTIEIANDVKSYNIQPFTGALEEDEVTLTSTSAGTTGTTYAENFFKFSSESVVVDGDDFAYFLVAKSAPNTKVELTPSTGTSHADDTIVEEPDGDVTIVSADLTAGGEYRLVVEPKDDDGNSIGTIEIITEIFTY